MLSTIKMYFNAGMLEITAAKPSHSGRYTCSARNPAGVAHKHISLTVQGKKIQASWEDIVQLMGA